MWRMSFAFSASLSVKSALRQSGGTARTELLSRSVVSEVSMWSFPLRGLGILPERSGGTPKPRKKSINIRFHCGAAGRVQELEVAPLVRLRTLGGEEQAVAAVELPLRRT